MRTRTAEAGVRSSRTSAGACSEHSARCKHPSLSASFSVFAGNENGLAMSPFVYFFFRGGGPVGSLSGESVGVAV